MSVIGRLTIIRGAPGSGKTTLARSMIACGMADDHFEADMYFTSADGSYVYDRSKIRDAHDWCLRQTVSALFAGRKVVVSNTFTREWELAPYIRLGNPQIIRCEGRFRNIHGVPDSKVDEMRARMENV